jgi:hypothetical protein
VAKSIRLKTTSGPVRVGGEALEVLGSRASTVVELGELVQAIDRAHDGDLIDLRDDWVEPLKIAIDGFSTLTHLFYALEEDLAARNPPQNWIAVTDEITDASARIRTALLRLLAARAGGKEAMVNEVAKVATELDPIPVELVLVEAVNLIEAALLVDDGPFCDFVAERIDMAGLLSELERIVESS